MDLFLKEPQNKRDYKASDYIHSMTMAEEKASLKRQSHHTAHTKLTLSFQPTISKAYLHISRK